jgi:hypothetical protein
MRCTRIEFSGYMRLLQAGCNVDDRLVAFVGPNEAGKTSVLRGLAWIDLPGTEPLSAVLASRGEDFTNRKDSDTVVKAVYRLDEADWSALRHLGYASTSETYRYSYWRQRDGGRVHSLSPRLKRDPEPFKRALRALGRAPAALENALIVGDQAFEDDDSALNVRALHRDTVNMLENPDRNPPEAKLSNLRVYAKWLSELSPASGKAALTAAAAQLTAIADVLEDEHPNEQALSILDGHRPRFREFAPEDRELESEFDTNQEPETISRPLERILDLAQTSLAYLKGIWADEGSRDTHLQECNERLTEIFRKAWSQSSLTVYLKAEQSILKIQVRVVEDGKTYYSTFGERSDGLRAFIALVGFLHALPDKIPPILLIDEAETHLHLDAQADLIRVLQDKVQATQVFYTTHSPGCLPLDLGRGLRFVEPTERHYSSEISHNFWDSRHPGFSAVLFKMGAAAFAFSALRNAVLAEGAADMILLPTLIRLATQSDTLPYQIAPRLNDLDEDEVRRSEVAANVVYLVDGDKGGTDKKKNLTRKHHVPHRLIVSHPSGYAVEDYVDPSLLLETINELRTDKRASMPITLSSLPVGETIGQRVDRWFAHHKVEGPGKVAVATRLANKGADLALKPGAKTRLARLHVEITTALDSRHRI